MHGILNIKFTDAKHAREIHQFKNIKRKLHKTIATIWFNKSCKQQQLTPNYINIHINGNNRQCQNTIRMATLFRINQGDVTSVGYFFINFMLSNFFLLKLCR
jgi:hypothetical protein